MTQEIKNSRWGRFKNQRFLAENKCDDTNKNLM